MLEWVFVYIFCRSFIAAYGLGAEATLPVDEPPAIATDGGAQKPTEELRLEQNYREWDRAYQLGQLGEYEASIALYRNVSDELEDILGQTHRDTLATRMNLAFLLHITKRADEAEMLYRQILAALDDATGIAPDHPDVLQTRMNLALLLEDTGLADEAEALYREVLAAQENAEQMGPDHPSTLRTRMNLANLLADTGRVAEAEALYREALAAMEEAEAIGVGHPETIRTRVNLALLLDTAGRAAEAEALYRQALRAMKVAEGLGPDHPDTLRTRMNLANLLANTGRVDEAEALYRQTLAEMEVAVTLGPNHPNTLLIRMNLARLLADTGRAAEAETAYRETLAAQEAAEGIGPGHPDTLQTRMNLAILLDTTGRAAEAEALYREVLAAQEAAEGIGPGHRDTLLTRMNLANLLQAAGQVDEAEAIYRQTLAAQEAAGGIGPGHRETLQTRVNLANLLQAAGQVDEAEALYRQTLAAQEAAGGIGPDHRETLQTRVNLANLLQAAGQVDEAEALYRQTLAAQEAAEGIGPGHPDTLGTRMNLALLLWTTGRAEEAETLYRQTLTAQEATQGVGPDHRETLQTHMNLANLFQSTGRVVEAEALYRRTLAAMEAAKGVGPDHPDTLQTRMNLANLFDTTGRADEAEALYRQTLAAQEAAQGIGPGHRETLQTRVNLATLLANTGRFSEAASEYTAALSGQIASLGEEHPEVQLTRTNLGAVLLEAGHSAEALAPLRYALDARRARTSDSAGKATEATRVLLGDEQGTTAFKLALAAWEVARTGGSDIERPGALRDEAWEALQTMGAGSAAEALARATARAGARDTELQDLVSDWEAAERARDAADRQIADLAARTDLVAETRAGIRSEIESSRLEAGTALRAALEQIGTAYPDFLNLIAPDPVSRIELQAGVDGTAPLLGADEALVLLTPPAFGQPGFVWALSREKAEWARIDMSAAELAEAIDLLRAGIGDPETLPVASKVADTPADEEAEQVAMAAVGDRSRVNPDMGEAPGFDRQAAFELYSDLLGDPAIRKVIQGKTNLILAPQGMLLSLPFAVLVTEEPQGHNQDPAALRDTAWLGIKTALTTLPAPANLRSLRRPAGEEKTGDGTVPGDGDRPGDSPWAGAGGDARLPLIAIGNPDFGRGAGDPEACDAERSGASYKIAAADDFIRGAIADAGMLSGLTPLPCTEPEALGMTETLWRDHGGIDAARAADALLLGKDATETALYDLSENGTLARADILLFATHGLLGGGYTPGKMSEPGLAVTVPDAPTAYDRIEGAASPEAAARMGARIDDGLIGASEVARLRLDADWVILSACDTAAAGTEGGEGLTGLASAFLFAGARSLLVSHWPVRDDVAARLTTDAVRRLAETPELSRAEALRQAMETIMDDTSDDDTSHSLAHPRAWAPFLLVGAG